MSQEPVDINLCAGAGGLAIGLSQAGFRVTQYYDQDSSACETLRHNVQQSSQGLGFQVMQGDLTQVDWLFSGARIRLLAAGVPCQPFSRGGNHRGQEDQRNLFPSVIRALRVLRPQVVLFENVRGLERQTHRQYLEYVLDQIRYPDCGIGRSETWQEHSRRLQHHAASPSAHPAYTVTWAVLNAADYGVAQVRHRLFIVATESNLPAYNFPEPTHSRQQLLFEQANGVYWEKRLLNNRNCNQLIQIPPSDESRPAWRTVRDALAELPPPAQCEACSRDNHWVIEGARSYPGHTGSSLDWPSKTLKAGVHGVPGGENTLIQDDGTLRYYTLREMARVQSFPDNYFFLGARSSVVRQIGNAVPCNLATQVALPLRMLLQDKDTLKGTIT